MDNNNVKIAIGDRRKSAPISGQSAPTTTIGADSAPIEVGRCRLKLKKNGRRWSAPISAESAIAHFVLLPTFGLRYGGK